MSTIGNTNYTFNFMPQVVAKSDNQAADSLYNVTSIRKQDAQQQENNKNNYGSGTQALQESIHNLNQKMVSLGKTSNSQEESPLDQFLTESNQLHNQLQNISNTKLAQSAVVDDIQNWRLSVIHELAHTEHAKNTEASANRQATLLNQVVSLVHSVNEHAEVSLPIGETLSSRSAVSNDDSSDSPKYNSDDSPKTKDPAPPPTDDDINLYDIMMSLVISGTVISNNAINMQSTMNKLLQDMVSEMQNFLALITTVTKAYKDCQTQILVNAQGDSGGDSSGASFGWDKKSQKDSKDMATLLTEGNNAANWSGFVNENGGGNNIQLCFYSPKNPDGTTNTSPINPLLLNPKYATSPDGPNGKHWCTETQLNQMLIDTGASLAPFIGGNLNTYNSNGFADVNTIDGLTKSVNAAIDNMNSQSGANISKLNLANQGLNSAISNFITLVSNVLSNMMKLAAV